MQMRLTNFVDYMLEPTILFIIILNIIWMSLNLYKKP